MKQLTILCIVLSILSIISGIMIQKWDGVIGWGVALIWQINYLLKLLENEQ
jgi:vacuolar-type H+-ATPase subunit I/STV1